MKKVIYFMFIIMFSSGASARKISEVLPSGGSFDPWNTTKWALWYTSGKLTDRFEIDRSVTFASGTSSSSPWNPDVSSLPYDYIFYLSNSCRGVTVNGNNAFIDLRPSTYSLSTLYSWWWTYSDSSLYGLDRCFYVSQSYSSSYPATVISNLWMKGFIQAVRTSSSQRHPLTIQNCNFRFNQWGVYLSGEATTVTGNSILHGLKGGMYCGSGSGRNNIIGNTFQDNDIEESNYLFSSLYGDIAMDTAHHTLIENNTHLAPADGDYHCGIKIYRNKGEDGNLRENSPNQNIIRNNTFTSYSVAYEVGSRMGRNDDYDLAGEGREDAAYNLFANNNITNTTIGIVIKCSGNTLQGNTFTSVTKPIVLHCVFYSLSETTINDQAGDNVYYWFVDDDYSSYSSWFPYADDRNGSIAASAKLLHIRSDYGQPNFQTYTGPATVIKTPSLIVGSANRAPDLSGDQYENSEDISILGQFWRMTGCDVDNDFCNGTDLNFNGSVNTVDLSKIVNKWLTGNDMADVYAAGGTPIDIAVGDYWVGNAGDEVAVIWDTPVSNIDGTNYYSIIIYDSNGIEINRCGRSTVRWEAIAAGNFVNIGNSETGQEIAAVHSTPINTDKYPIYIFGRGRSDPNKTMLTTNTTKIIDLAGGNFNTATDSYDEVAALYTGGTSIAYCKPTVPAWTATTTGTASLTKIAAGNFDSTSGNGDEIAGINASSSLIYFYRPAGTTYYNTAGTSGLPVWTAIGAGEFDGGTTRKEVAVASSSATDGVYKISYYVASASTAFKQNDMDVLGVSARSLDGGKVYAAARLGLYEQADGFYSSNYGSVIGLWGEHCVVLPSAPQTTATPLFWLNANAGRQHLKVTPIVK